MGALLEYGELAKQVDEMRQQVENNVEPEIKNIISDASYANEIIRCKGCVNTSVVAKELGMSSAIQLNNELSALHVIFKNQDGEWELSSQYCGHNLTKNRTVNYEGTTKHYFVWTEKGRHFLHKICERGLISTVPMPTKKTQREKVYKFVEVEKKEQSFSKALKNVKEEVDCLINLAKNVKKAEDITERNLLINDVVTISSTLSSTINAISNYCIDACLNPSKN